jgi:uncharacterized protein (DUF58 family)
MSADTRNTEGITWVSQQSLIQLRHSAINLPLDSGKVHAHQGGAYLSSFKGRGMEFDESRIYLPGDDIRSMDWKVTARTGQPYTKVFQEEHERPVLIWLDLNSSMFFATRGAYKSVIASKAATLLAWSAAANKDRLGALIFAGDDHIELRPKLGKSAVLNFIKHTCNHPAWNSNTTDKKPRNMNQAMSRLRKVARPGSLIFMISDFREIDDKAKSHLSSIARNNDIVLIHISDPIELSLPESGQYRVSDSVNELTLNASNKKLRNEYQKRFTRHQNKLLKICRQNRMHLLPISTADNVLDSLQNGMGIRANKHSQFRTSR